MLRSLPGADPAKEADGDKLVKRALELFKNHVTIAQRKWVTIAVAIIADVEVAVVYHRHQHTADRIAGRLRKLGVAATGTSGNDHAEVVLHQREPGVPVMGISNPKGPCPACKAYFGNLPSGFGDVYWDTQSWIPP